MPPEDQEPGIFVPFKDLLDDLNKSLTGQFAALALKLDELNRKLDGKADISRVIEVEKKLAFTEERIEKRFDGVDVRLGRLELVAAGQAAVSKYKWAFVTIVLALITAVSYIVSIALGGHA